MLTVAQRDVSSVSSSVPLAGHCAGCGLRELCLVEGLSAAEIDRLAGMVTSRRRLKRGEALFRAGDAFNAVYPVRLGFFKTCVSVQAGLEQVTGFPMPGDVLGFDAISTGAFQCDAIALQDSEVCVVPFERLETLSRQFDGLQHQLHRVLSREIVRDNRQMLLLGKMRAEQRVATFLLNLSKQFAQRGFSSREFVLRMTRDEIGNYLGLKLETVSRAFSRLQADGVIAVDQKQLRIEDIERLGQIAGTACPMH